MGFLFFTRLTNHTAQHCAKRVRSSPSRAYLVVCSVQCWKNIYSIPQFLNYYDNLYTKSGGRKNLQTSTKNRRRGKTQTLTQLTHCAPSSEHLPLQFMGYLASKLAFSGALKKSYHSKTKVISVFELQGGMSTRSECSYRT